MAQEDPAFAEVALDLLAIQSEARQAARRYDRYLRDAEDAGLTEVAFFIRLLLEEDLSRAAHCEGLLRDLGGGPGTRTA
jgi:hypothetical protein